MITFRNHLLVCTVMTSLFVGAEVRAVNPALPSIPTNVFIVTAFGVLGNGAQDNTVNIQNAINAASAAGGGIVVFPAGKYLSGPLTLHNRINLRLEDGARLMMLPLGRYPGGTNPPTFIVATNRTDLEISGRGTFDGQGADWWAACRTNRDMVRPMLFNFYSCKRIFIHDVTFTAPPFHHCGLRRASGDITVSNLTVNTDPDSPNTDGLNISGTNVLVINCRISAGDDNIALGAAGFLGDTLISNCVFGFGHGVSLGSGVRNGVSDLVVANCSFNGTIFGIRMKADNDSGGLVKNLFYHDITMTNVHMPILIYSYYDLAGGPAKIIKQTPKQIAALPAEPLTNTTPVWRDISFSNITAYGTVAGGALWGKPAMAISNINFVNVNLTAPGSFNIYNARGIRFQDCRITLKGGDNKFTTYNADVFVNGTQTASATGQE